MIFVHDTRDRESKHTNVDAYLLTHGHKIVRSKLFVGDLALLHDQHICVDLKADVMELIMDICHDHPRFRDECIRASENEIQLFVVVEEKLPDNDLSKWRPPLWRYDTPRHKAGEPMTKASPANIKAAMQTMESKYGVRFAFCSPDQTGALVCRLLEVPDGYSTSCGDHPSNGPG